MALGVVRYMNQRAANAGRQLLAAHIAWNVEVRTGQIPHPSSRIFKRCLNLSQQLSQRLLLRTFSSRALRLQQLQLIGSKLPALGIGQDAIGSPRNMAQMKCN